MSYIERGKAFLDIVKAEVELALENAGISIPVFAQHYLTASDTGHVPYVSIILDRIEPEMNVIGGGMQTMNIIFAVTLVEKYKEEYLFTDLPVIESALSEIQDKYDDLIAAYITAVDVGYEEIGNIVLEASQLTFIVNTV
ncbi:MAG: hypothetical protein KAX49_03855 [Halanaerobiales bacterium]|nr:hypothetical protein [Halanaerobiales bacterium]